LTGKYGFEWNRKKNGLYLMTITPAYSICFYSRMMMTQDDSIYLRNIGIIKRVLNILIQNTVLAVVYIAKQVSRKTEAI
jgi:hypothetical protein